MKQSRPIVEPSGEWIRRGTGVRERYVAGSAR